MEREIVKVEAAERVGMDNGTVSGERVLKRWSLGGGKEGHGSRRKREGGGEDGVEF